MLFPIAIGVVNIAQEGYYQHGMILMQVSKTKDHPVRFIKFKLVHLATGVNAQAPADQATAAGFDNFIVHKAVFIKFKLVHLATEVMLKHLLIRQVMQGLTFISCKSK